MTINVELKYGSQSLYKVLDDEDGHKYLIPFQEYDEVKAQFENILEAQDDDLYDQIEDLLDTYEKLEGAEILVMLQSEVISVRV
ncbi:hypothetical protein [Acinetobacter baumannii]|uniref:hypothetical protein n=1 Tax=Acinetobacter baumannii TaxID=470 RepID=UPI00367212D5